jgi:two-component system invasion response regulator UvrY
MIDVILCDDHALIRRGIRDTLTDAADIRVVGEAGDYGELRALMRSLAPRRARPRRVTCWCWTSTCPGAAAWTRLHALKDEGSP